MDTCGVCGTVTDHERRHDYFDSRAIAKTDDSLLGKAGYWYGNCPVCFLAKKLLAKDEEESET